MVHFEVGVLEVHDEPTETALQRTIEFVAASVHRLRLPLLQHGPDPMSCCSRVLVFGRESDQCAQHIAERNFFSRTVGSPLYEEPDAPGVFWVSDVAELEELDNESFDAVMVFNLASFSRFRGLFPLLQRVLRPGGVFAGTGVFQTTSAPKEGHSSPISDFLDPSFSLREFRHFVENSGFLVQITMDLTMEGELVLAVEADAKRTEFRGPELYDPQLICARFLATKSVVGRPLVERVAKPVSSPVAQRNPVVVTGVSLGLPNELRQECSVFDQRNFSRVFSGENCISVLTLDQKQKILDQNIVQVLKVDGQRVKRKLTKPSEVISLASRLGHFDLVKEYGVPPHVVETLDITYQLAIAAGLEALSSAGIPVLKRGTSASGNEPAVPPSVVPLPDELQADTGVIFASSFPCAESIVQEVSLCASHHTQRFIAECQAMKESGKDPKEYEFDRKLLFKLLVMANNQLAELIHARGPNTHVNSACASTSQAIAIAHDWIRVGRCKRVVVISADNATSDNLLPYIGTGFLALTAASVAPTVETGAVPFDKRRSGMILGMGAVGMVLESSSVALNRGARPMVELVGSYFLNSAFHASLLDREHISVELSRFIEKIEAETGVPRVDLAKDCIYYSHETQTSAQGGCAKAEMDALTKAFGEAGKCQILIANTKGFTGHPMGVGLEDVVAVASLDQNLVPPIANYKERDPCLGDIQLAQGGIHSRRYALRFSAGFGSQFVFLLFKKWGPDCLTPLPCSAATSAFTSAKELSFAESETDDGYDTTSIDGEVDGDDTDCHQQQFIAVKKQSGTTHVFSRLREQYLRQMSPDAPIMSIAEDPDEPESSSDEQEREKAMAQLMGFSYTASTPYQPQVSESSSFASVQAPVAPHTIAGRRRAPAADVGDSCNVM